MPITPGRSSKEWNAFALERDREANAEAVRQQNLQSQLAALQAQLQEAQENERKIKEEAAINRQAAKNEEFNEISLAQQGKFRAMLADETFTRVAQTAADDDADSMAAVAQGRPSSVEFLTRFKAILWKAVAGDDSIFLQQAAQKITARYKKPITNGDILTIRNSVSCFGADFTNQNAPVERTERGVAQKDLREPFDEVGSHVSVNFQAQHMGNSGGPPARIASVENNAEQDERSIKLETFEQVSDRRNPMDVIERDTPTTVRSASIAASDVNIQLTDPLGHTITGDEHNRIERNSTLEAAPETPSSTNRKRLLEDESTPTPSEIDDTSAAKKRKTARQKSIAKSPSAKFEDYIGAQFASGDLRDYDLACNVCGQEAKKPRVASQCHHVYCSGCFNAHKGEAKGRELHKVICARQGCGSAVGVMNIVREDTIAQLKTTYITENRVQGIDGDAHTEDD